MRTIVVMYWDRYITQKGPILGRKFLLEENDWLVTRLHVHFPVEAIGMYILQILSWHCRISCLSRHHAAGDGRLLNISQGKSVLTRFPVKVNKPKVQRTYMKWNSRYVKIRHFLHPTWIWLRSRVLSWSCYAGLPFLSSTQRRWTDPHQQAN